jgi:1-acyl-sn-glycerol-3-phosphate acyltransferase
MSSPQYFNILARTGDHPQPSIITFTTLLKDLKQMRWDSYKDKGDFEDQFRNDPQVINHVQKTLLLELETGALDEAYYDQRYEQLMQWFQEYYYKELFSISNVNSDTRNHMLYLHSAYILFNHILPTIFKDGIWVHKETFDSFKKRSKQLNNPLLLLPNHQSHIDYIIIHYLYVLSNLDTPLVIAGENLNVPVFGHILKKLGAIFIRRKFTNDDFWYTSNMKHLLSKKMNSNPQIELFIEGTRSRNGKLMLPKTGFIQLIKDSLKGHDAFIQPISLVYEKPYEFKEYLIELNGMDKVQESFMSIFSTGSDLLMNKSPNFGRLVINFDPEFLKMNDYPSVKKLCDHTMRRIHEIEYITDISVLGLTLSILFYRDVHVKKIDKLETINLMKQLITMLLEKTTGNDHLLELLDMDDTILIGYCSSLLGKFLNDYVILTQDSFIIVEETSLVYFKNSLLNWFVSEMFLLKTNHHLPTLQILKRLFDFEFLTTKIDEYQKMTPQCSIFSKLLDPFIESYEVVLKNLQGVISINLKSWLHLLYLSSPRVSFKESLNKSNLLYAIYTLQSLNLIKVTKVNHLEVIDEDGLRLFTDYLHLLRKNEPLENEDKVFQRVLQSSSRL